MSIAFQRNYADWMGELPEYVRRLPIIYIAIPGSHHTMSYTLKLSATIAPDSEQIIEGLGLYGPLLSSILYRWCQTQRVGLTNQLLFGVRYLHFFLYAKRGTYTFVHGLVGVDVETGLQEVLAFIKDHKGELVILDFNEFFNFGGEDHRKMRLLLKEIFGNTAVMRPDDVRTITLENTTDRGQNVLIIYRHCSCYASLDLLPSEMFPMTTANHTDDTLMIIKLNTALAARNSSLGYVTRCANIPTARFLATHVTSNLKEKLARPLMTNKIDWLTRQTPGPRGINIVISDFIGLNEFEFIKVMIGLNKKIPKPKKSKTQKMYR